jgi:hypothetical protein
VSTGRRKLVPEHLTLGGTFWCLALVKASVMGEPYWDPGNQINCLKIVSSKTTSSYSYVDNLSLYFYFMCGRQHEIERFRRYIGALPSRRQLARPTSFVQLGGDGRHECTVKGAP